MAAASPSMSMPRSDARARSMSTESCGCVWSAESWIRPQRPSFSIAVLRSAAAFASSS